MSEAGNGMMMRPKNGVIFDGARDDCHSKMQEFEFNRQDPQESQKIGEIKGPPQPLVPCMRTFMNVGESAPSNMGLSLTDNNKKREMMRESHRFVCVIFSFARQAHSQKKHL